MAEQTRTETNNIVRELKGHKLHAKYEKQQKSQTVNRTKIKETQEGFKMLDPSIVIPKYLEDEDVKTFQNELITCARTNHVPSDSKFLEFTNFLLERLNLKNGKRKEVFTGMTNREFLKAKQQEIKIYDVSPADKRELARGDKNVYSIGDGNACRIEVNPIVEDSPSAMEGVLLEREVHKVSGKTNESAVVFLSLPDMILLDSYHAVATAYCKKAREQGKVNMEYGLDSTFFINTRGSQIEKIDFTKFCEVSGYGSYNSHYSRNVYATFMTNQNNMQLREYAAFAASHSFATQQATYVGAHSKRLAAIVADQFYQRNVASMASTGGDRYTINPQYDHDTGADMREMDREEWAQCLQRRRMEDLGIQPTPERVITPDVVVAILSLIVTIGVEGSFEKQRGEDPLKVFLSGKRTFFNKNGKSLFLTMMDFAPELQSTRILQENLDYYCNILPKNTDLHQIEIDWTEKILEVIRNFEKRTHDLSVRQKDILAPLNLDENYEYCFDNKAVKLTLEAFNKGKFAKEQSIKRRTNTGTAVSIVQMIKQLAHNTDRRVNLQKQKLDDAALNRQSQQEEESRKKRQREQETSHSERGSFNSSTPSALEAMYNEPPPPADETVALSRGESGKRRRINMTPIVK